MIVVDPREEPSEILQELDRLGLPHEEKMLEVCDYDIYGRQIIQVSGPNGDIICFLIERKNDIDYVQSLISGHLNDQLIRMSQVAKHTALVFIGSLNGAIQKTGVNRLSVYSSVAGTFLRHSKDGVQGSISFIMLETLQDFALLLQCIQKKLDDEAGLIRQPELTLPQVSDKNYLLRSLMGCPDIGEVKARALLEKYGSIANLCELKPDDFKTVPGIGPVLAMNLFNHLHGLYTNTLSS